MFKRRHYVALGAVVLATLLILSLPSRATLRLKIAISSLFLPLFGLASTTQQAPIAAADAITPRRELLRQLEQLRQEKEQDQVLALQAAAVMEENQRLRALLGWQQREPWRLRLANVIVRDPANWWRTVQIDLGSRDGVRENLPVLTAEGLVGRVSVVSYAHSQVVLIGDPDCKVSVTVDDPAHDMGIIGPGGALGNSYVKLGFLSGNAALKPGQNVTTSGLGGIYPKGIPVGQIVDAQQVEFGLYTEARVKLAVDLGSLEQVGVLFQ